MVLIDKYKLRTRLQQYEDFECPANETAFKVVSQIRSLLWNQPIITLDDLRPKGRWLERYGVSEYKYECSVCNMGSDLMTDFCPNCGADMRGEWDG